MEASPDLQPISLRFQEMTTNDELGFQTSARLPNDIINEIIERLPAISNFRFKCVSKQWLSHNSEALKLKSQTHTMPGIFYVTYKGERDIGAKYVTIEKDQNDDSCIDGALSFLPEHRFMRIHDSCNGLLLCECWDTPPNLTDNSDQTSCLYVCDNSDQTSCLYVCNPATRKWVEIPYISMKATRLALEFNPVVSVHFNVIIIKCGYLASRNFKVFSSKTGEWSVSQIMDTFPSRRRLYWPVLIYNGLIYAIELLESAEIIGFDVNGNLRSTMDLPGKSYLNDEFLFSRLGLFGGCLHYYCIDSNSKVYVWKLESGSWLLKRCFSVPFPVNTIKDIKFHPIKEDVVLLKIDDRLYSYNVKTTLMAELLCSQILAFGCCLYSPFYLDVFGNGWKING